MIKNKWAAFIFFVVMFLILWNALQYFMGHFEDGYSLRDDLLFPFIVAVACGYVTYLRDDPFKRKEEEQRARENNGSSGSTEE